MVHQCFLFATRGAVLPDMRQAISLCLHLSAMHSLCELSSDQIPCDVDIFIRVATCGEKFWKAPSMAHPISCLDTGRSHPTTLTQPNGLQLQSQLIWYKELISYDFFSRLFDLSPLTDEETEFDRLMPSRGPFVSSNAPVQSPFGSLRCFATLTSCSTLSVCRLSSSNVAMRFCKCSNLAHVRAVGMMSCVPKPSSARPMVTFCCWVGLLAKEILDDRINTPGTSLSWWEIPSAASDDQPSMQKLLTYR